MVGSCPSEELWGVLGIVVVVGNSCALFLYCGELSENCSNE